MAQKHTQGPWTISGSSIWNAETHRAIYASGCKPINERDEEGQANARLIAAAPTMASRIQGALDCLSQNKVFPADIENAKALLVDALNIAGITDTGLNRFEATGADNG